MALADTKKAQTLINRAAAAAEAIQAASADLEAVRTLYNAANVNPTGTPLQGNVAAVSNWIDSVVTVASSAVADAMIAAKVPSHRGEAL